MQLVTTPDGRKILLDGAHNIDGAKTLISALKDNFSEKPALILGILEDKNWREICAELTPHVSRILAVRVASERSADPEQLRDVCREFRPDLQIEAFNCLSEALNHAVDEKFVLIAGSLYLIGEAMELLHLIESPGTDEKSLNEWTAKKT
jgi:dihydrofolate synthase/folylpolyglutamate synthase